MTNEQLAAMSRDALAAFERLPPDAQAKRLIESGTIDSNGNVLMGRTMTLYAIGDRVVANRTTWMPNDFDDWGRGVGVGVVIEPPFPMDPDEIDVRWPAGRCFEHISQLLPYKGD